jgi:hypothetical protein
LPELVMHEKIADTISIDTLIAWLVTDASQSSAS